MLPGRCASPEFNSISKPLSPIKFPNDGGNSLVQFVGRYKCLISSISCKIFGNFLILSHAIRLKNVRDFIVRQLGRVSSFTQLLRSHTLSLSRCPTESSISTKFLHPLINNCSMFGVIDKLGIFVIRSHQLKSTYVTDTKFCRKKKIES